MQNEIEPRVDVSNEEQRPTQQFVIANPANEIQPAEVSTQPQPQSREIITSRSGTSRAVSAKQETNEQITSRPGTSKMPSLQPNIIEQSQVDNYDKPGDLSNFEI
jgi:hypothetical protein